jgi:hypothetical protein
VGASDAFFELVVDALVGFLPEELADFHHRVGWNGVKVWYGSDHREHYECQYLARPDGKPGAALEIGFHAEHPDHRRNDATLATLRADERSWRRALGKQAEAGAFLGGRADTWTRVSEVWLGDEVLRPDAAVEAADRLATYIEVLEPRRAAASSAATAR